MLQRGQGNGHPGRLDNDVGIPDPTGDRQPGRRPVAEIMPVAAVMVLSPESYFCVSIPLACWRRAAASMRSELPRFTAPSCLSPFIKAERLRRCLPASSATLAWLRSVLTILELSSDICRPPRIDDLVPVDGPDYTATMPEPTAYKFSKHIGALCVTRGTHVYKVGAELGMTRRISFA
jgi:hypothetical protein